MVYFRKKATEHEEIGLPQLAINHDEVPRLATWITGDTVDLEKAEKTNVIIIPANQRLKLMQQVTTN